MGSSVLLVFMWVRVCINLLFVVGDKFINVCSCGVMKGKNGLIKEVNKVVNCKFIKSEFVMCGFFGFFLVMV